MSDKDYENYAHELFERHVGRPLESWADDRLQEMKVKFQEMTEEAPEDADIEDIILTTLAIGIIEAKANVRLLEAKLVEAGILDMELRVVNPLSQGESPKDYALEQFCKLPVGCKFLHVGKECEKIADRRYRIGADTFPIEPLTEVAVKVVKVGAGSQ